MAKNRRTMVQIIANLRGAEIEFRKGQKTSECCHDIAIQKGNRDLRRNSWTPKSS
jgi:hypothetical protein